MLYPGAAVERAMRIQEVICRAIAGKIQWFQAAEILGVSARTMSRWKSYYEKKGYDGLFDRRKRRPSPKRVPYAQVETVLRLFREKYADKLKAKTLRYSSSVAEPMCWRNCSSPPCDPSGMVTVNGPFPLPSKRSTMIRSDCSFRRTRRPPLRPPLRGG